LRHEHEWQNAKVPPGKILMPKVVSHATNLVSGYSIKLQFIAPALEDAFNQANVAIQSAMACPISCGESSWT
jgi:hypothetical protein